MITTAVSWKRYLMMMVVIRVKRFLESEVIRYSIKYRSSKRNAKGKPDIMFIVHPNIGNVIIKKQDYYKVLDTNQNGMKKEKV